MNNPTETTKCHKSGGLFVLAWAFGLINQQELAHQDTSATGLLVFILILAETKGRSLEEIETLWMKR